MKQKLTLLILILVSLTINAQNPYLPLWEYIPDGEPYVFEDPDNPGQYRVYIYGSHDSRKTDYCGLEQVVWSASVNDLASWRYDGVIFTSEKDAEGNLLRPDASGDILFAPDVANCMENGKMAYFFYPNNQSRGRQSMVARSQRPNGPFEVINWSKTDAKRTEGVLTFDPAVFVDDDGRVYGYWGFEKSFAAEIDPKTMATVKEGTEIVSDLVSNYKQDGVFNFYEASSMRKIKDKYVFIYSRYTEDGEFGMPASNYTLAYAYGNNPLGPFTYGGTLIDCRGRDTDLSGNPLPTATCTGNTHGSIVEINGQWFVFYHRQTGLDEYSRQAMVSPIDVKVIEGPDGKVEICEGEYTSEGFATEGLNPYKKYSAGIACYYTGPTPSHQEYPRMIYTGSYIQNTYNKPAEGQDSYSCDTQNNPMVNNVDGSVFGYKYFNMNLLKKGKSKLELELIPQGIDGTITIMMDSPFTEKGGKVLGTIQVKTSDAQQLAKYSSALKGLSKVSGKHSIFFKFSSAEKEKSICTLQTICFR